MEDPQQDTSPPSPEPADVVDRSETPEPDAIVELIGQLDEGPAGFVRLFENPTRDGRYADVKIRDVVRLLPEEAAGTAAAATVIEVRGSAVVLVCDPVDADALDDATTLELRANKRPERRRTKGWPRRGGQDPV